MSTVSRGRRMAARSRTPPRRAADSRLHTRRACTRSPHTAALRARSSIAQASIRGRVFSPDGRQIAFISTNGRTDIMSSRSLTVVAAAGGAPRVFVLDDAWVNEFVWSRDSRSIYLQANDGTFGRGEHMFDQPVARRVDRRRAGGARRHRGDRRLLHQPEPGRPADGATRRSKRRTMGDVVVLDVASRRATTITDVNPELHDFALGELKPITWRSFDGMEIWGLLLTPSTASRRPTTPAAGLRARRTRRRLHARPLPAVHAYRPAGRSVSDRGDGERGFRGALPDAARRRGLRRGRAARHRQRVGRCRLQGHHDRRGRAGRAGHRGSAIGSA